MVQNVIESAARADAHLGHKSNLNGDLKRGGCPSDKVICVDLLTILGYEERTAKHASVLGMEFECLLV